VNEDCQLSNPEHNHGAETTRLSGAFARNPLLDHASTEIGINQAAIRILDCRTKLCIAELVLPCKPSEWLVFEDAHSIRTVFNHRPKYSTKRDTSHFNDRRRWNVMKLPAAELRS
jgi:hypothetical protein